MTIKYKYKFKEEVIIMNQNEQEYLVQKIRTQYTEKKYTQLDKLTELDSKVKKPANIFTYVFGSLGAIIMGSGMSLIMTDFGTKIGISDPMFLGIVISIIAMAIMIINYPIYKNILSSRRKKYADQIIVISDKIIKG